MSNSVPAAIDAVKVALSPSRIATYEREIELAKDQTPSALELYAWNANISGAFLVPLQVCEVVIRNAISDALSDVYEERWPWNRTFDVSLPRARRTELDEARRKRGINTTGKVIPELTFFFWQNMFTYRHDERVWKGRINLVLPHLDHERTYQDNRLHVFHELDHIRHFRNRIAHHEPIFNRNLLEDYQRIIGVIRLRCEHTAEWVEQNQSVTELLERKPF